MVIYSYKIPMWTFFMLAGYLEKSQIMFKQFERHIPMKMGPISMICCV